MVSSTVESGFLCDSLHFKFRVTETKLRARNVQHTSFDRELITSANAHGRRLSLSQALRDARGVAISFPFTY